MLRALRPPPRAARTPLCPVNYYEDGDQYDAPILHSSTIYGINGSGHDVSIVYLKTIFLSCVIRDG